MQHVLSAREHRYEAFSVQVNVIPPRCGPPHDRPKTLPTSSLLHKDLLLEFGTLQSWILPLPDAPPRRPLIHVPSGPHGCADDLIL